MVSYKGAIQIGARGKHMIISGGENSSSMEVEDVIYRRYKRFLQQGLRGDIFT